MQNRIYLHNDRGFTLIELLVVISIISILATIGLLSYKNSNDQARLGVCNYNRAIIERAYSAYNTLGGANVPASGSTSVTFLVTAGYLASDLTSPGYTYIWTQDAAGYPHLSCSLTGAVASSTLFNSTFADATGINWIMGGGTVQGGALVPNTTGQNRTVLSGTYGTDYEINANVEYISGQGYGIYYRLTAPEGSTALPTSSNFNISGYVFQFDEGIGNRFIIRKLTNGSESSPVANVAMTTAIPGFNLTAPHQITITVQGSNHIVKVDGTTVLTYADTSASAYTAGYVGTRTWTPVSGETTVVNFQDIKVVGL